VAIAITPDQQALQASLRDWAKQAAPLAAVRRTEQDDAAPSSSITDLAALGVFSIAVPEDAGGAGGTVADLAAALEQLAVALVPGPVLPTALAAVLAAPQLPALTDSALTGSRAVATAAVALDPGTLTGTRHPDGTLHVTGRTGPVLGAGTTSHLLLPARRLLPLPGRRHADRQRGPGNPDPDHPDYPARPRPGRHPVRRGGRGRGRLV
jgi:alkylation response protein AidB-like acyl-CoA dehydrogenase